MSGRGRGRGGGGGGFGGQLTGAKLFLKRSAVEAGLDDRNLYTLQDITRPRLYPDFQWHSSGKLASKVISTSQSNIDVKSEVDAANINVTGAANAVNVKSEAETLASTSSTPLNITKRTPTQIYLLNKQRELTELWQRSSQYVQNNPQIDVERYGRKNRQVAADVALLESPSSLGKLGSNIKFSERYFPTELLVAVTKNDDSLRINNKNTNSKNAAINNTDIPQVKLEVLEQKERATQGNGQAPNVDGNNEEDDNALDFEDLEEEEAEDYVTNYYESEDENGDDDGDYEATF